MMFQRFEARAAAVMDARPHVDSIRFPSKWTSKSNRRLDGSVRYERKSGVDSFWSASIAFSCKKKGPRKETAMVSLEFVEIW